MSKHTKEAGMDGISTDAEGVAEATAGGGAQVDAVAAGAAPEAGEAVGAGGGCLCCLCQSHAALFRALADFVQGVCSCGR